MSCILASSWSSLPIYAGVSNHYRWSPLSAIVISAGRGSLSPSQGSLHFAPSSSSSTRQPARVHSSTEHDQACPTMTSSGMSSHTVMGSRTRFSRQANRVSGFRHLAYETAATRVSERNAREHVGASYIYWCTRLASRRSLNTAHAVH